MKLSVVILTKNNERTIVDLLESVSFADEIIAIDDNSTDKTRDLIKHFSHKHVTIIQSSLNNNFSHQRNIALQKVTCDWVLFIDSDEYVSKELIHEMQQEIMGDSFDAYRIRRIDVIGGKRLQYGETGNIQFIRLAKRKFGKWTGSVHEVWNGEGKVGTLTQPLFHYPHQSIKEFLTEINFYSTLRAEELYKKGVKTSWVSVIAYPKAKFILNFFIKQGYKDGVQGLVMAMMMSFHSFLVRGKLYLLWKNGKK